MIVRDEDPTLDKGRAAVIQDIHAPPLICMNKILDFQNYPKYVSFLKKLVIYQQEIDDQVLLYRPLIIISGRVIILPQHYSMQVC